MECIECKTSNMPNSKYCSNCGAELGRTLDETVRKRGFRDRQATEMEITEAVVERLSKWGKWLGGLAGLMLLTFGFLLGKGYFDIHESLSDALTAISNSVQQATTTIGKSVQQAQSDIQTARQPIPKLNEQVKQLQADIGAYRKVNERIEVLQKQFNEVKGQVVDLGQRGLKVNGIESTATIKAKGIETSGEGPATMSFAVTGCPAAPPKGNLITFCSEGSPLTLFEMTPTNRPRPVSSVSGIGFQDTSTGAKPDCNASVRGTLYVQKGGNGVADEPFLCAKKSNNTYSWIEVGAVP